MTTSDLGGFAWTLRLNALRRSLRALLDAVDATGPTITAGAACHREGYLMAWWHPGETLGARNQRHNRARALCATCPVLDACAELAAAQPHDVLEGVWAGRVYRGELPSRIGRGYLRRLRPPNRLADSSP